MKIKTSELTGIALDWAVTYALHGGCASYIFKHGRAFHAYSTDWSQGGPIIEREKLSVVIQTAEPPLWFASCPRYCYKGYGHTPLVATMRCFVASRLGDEVEVPDELT